MNTESKEVIAGLTVFQVFAWIALVLWTAYATNSFFEMVITVAIVIAISILSGLKTLAQIRGSVDELTSSASVMVESSRKAIEDLEIKVKEAQKSGRFN